MGLCDLHSAATAVSHPIATGSGESARTCYGVDREVATIEAWRKGTPPWFLAGAEEASREPLCSGMANVMSREPVGRPASAAAKVDGTGAHSLSYGQSLMQGLCSVTRRLYLIGGGRADSRAMGPWGHPRREGSSRTPDAPRVSLSSDSRDKHPPRALVGQTPVRYER